MFHRVGFVGFCMNDTFHVNNSKSCSEQVCHSCRFDKMTWALRGIPFQVVLPTFDLISEFTHFNLVIRLSKVKQSAFFLFFTLSVAVLNSWPQYRALTFSFFNLVIRLSKVKQSAFFLFSPVGRSVETACRSLGTHFFFAWGLGIRTCFRYGTSFFWLSGEVQLCT